MFGVGVTIPAVYGNLSIAEGIEHAAAAGVDGIEFFDWESADHDELRSTADECDIEIVGTLAAGAGSNIADHDREAMVQPDSHETAVADIERSIEAAAELGCSTLVVTVGPDQPHLVRETQHDAVVDVLRSVAPAAENADVTVVPEPLNVLVDHPGYYLSSSSEGFEIIEAVDSPNVKLLFDVYHQQVTEGNIIQTLTDNIELVGHVHIADVPGRHEPETGELNYQNIFAALADTGYDGYVCGEFSPSDDPDMAVHDIVALADSL